MTGERKGKLVARQLGFDSYATTNTLRYKGGILLLSNEAVTDVHPIGSTEQELHAIVEVCSFHFK